MALCKFYYLAIKTASWNHDSTEVINPPSDNKVHNYCLSRTGVFGSDNTTTSSKRFTITIYIYITTMDERQHSDIFLMRCLLQHNPINIFSLNVHLRYLCFLLNQNVFFISARQKICSSYANNYCGHPQNRRRTRHSCTIAMIIKSALPQRMNSASLTDKTTWTFINANKNTMQVIPNGPAWSTCDPQRSFSYL